MGLTLLEVIIALAIMSVVVLGVTTLIDTYAQNMRASAAAQQVAAFGNAANAYIRDNYAAVQAVATAATPALIKVPTLTSTGYLASGFAPQNAYGQTICALVLQPTAGQLNALVVTEAGNAINDLDLGQLSGLIGGAGGGVYSGSSTTLAGTMGGWSMPVGAFANANSSGEHCDGSVGTVSIAVGHPVEALWFSGGDQTAGLLYRNAVPGQPSRNTMETPIVMDTSTIRTAGSACATSGAIARDAAGAVLSCQSGAWKAQGSLYWLDPMASYASLPGADPVGAVRITLDTGRAFLWTGGAWAALAVDQNGNLNVPNALVAAGGRVVAWNNVPEGGVLTLAGSNGVNVYLENINGTFRLVNSPWNSQLFSVDQSGNVWSNGAVTSTGRLTSGEYVQINGTASVGAGCSPNGMIGRDANGTPLACDTGTWRYPAPRGWQCTGYNGTYGVQFLWECAVYVPPTSNNLLLNASASVGNLCDGTEVGVRVDVSGVGTILGNFTSTPGGYTGNDEGTLIAPSSWGGRTWTLYGYNRSACADHSIAQMTISEVR